MFPQKVCIHAESKGVCHVYVFGIDWVMIFDQFTPVAFIIQKADTAHRELWLVFH